MIYPLIGVIAATEVLKTMKHELFRPKLYLSSPEIISARLWRHTGEVGCYISRIPFVN